MPNKKEKSTTPVEDTSSGDDSDWEHSVKIVDKQTVNGKVKYFLKFKCYPEDESTWKQLKCYDLIAAFEDKLKKKEVKKSSSSQARQRGRSSAFSNKENDREKEKVDDSPKPQKQEKVKKEASSDSPKGLDRKLEPEKIIGASDALGELVFLIKWKGTDEADLVPAKLANIKWPQIVIQFYEERLAWHT